MGRQGSAAVDALKNIVAFILTLVVGMTAGAWLSIADALESEDDKRRARGCVVRR